MSDPLLYLPSTVLRRSYERARSADHATQIQECADLLCCPDLLNSEIREAYTVVASFSDETLVEMARIDTRGLPAPGDESDCRHFVRSQEIKVSAEPSFAFRCVATDVLPVPELLPSPDDIRAGFDYVALSPELEADPILGVAQTFQDSSAYTLLLRALACFTELVPATRLEAFDQDHMKGALGTDPTFELHIVLWDEDKLTPQALTLCEFARDLAEVARSAIQSRPELAGRLGRIRCLRMDPRRFENRMWQVWEI
jgi:hypothetical protein